MEECEGYQEEPQPGPSRRQVVSEPVPVKRLRFSGILTQRWGNTKEGLFQRDLYPFDLMHEELWLFMTKIGALTPPDVLNLSRTNSQLNALFGPSSKILFLEVLPFLIKYLTRKSDLLKCRSVCKEWLRGVDNFLSKNHPCRRAFSGDQSQMDLISLRRHSSDFSLQRIGLEYVEFTPANQRKFDSIPITNLAELFALTQLTKVLFSRAVCLKVSIWWDELSIQTFFASAKAFLTMHGHLVNHFKFILYGTDLKIQVFYEMLVECVGLMPNLRSLHIESDISEDGTLDNIELMTNKDPLPPLNYLQTLNLEGLPIHLQKYFVSQFGPQLAKLTHDIDYGHRHGPQHFPENVQELKINGLTFDSFKCITSYVHRCMLLKCTKLTLDFSCICMKIDGTSILNMLETVPKLASLRIVLHGRNTFIPPWCYSCRRDAKPMALVSFEIEGLPREIFGMTSLLHFFPELKYLHFKDKSYYDQDLLNNYRDNDNQDFYGFGKKFDVASYLSRGEMYNSPLWDNLGQLKIFTFESDNGPTRSFWNREQAMWMREHMKHTSERGKEEKEHE